MLICKGGITRSIDDKRLHEYTAKGYAPAADVQAPPAAPKGDKPLKHMNTAELLAKAAELGMDISEAATNKQRVEAIQAFLAGAESDADETEE